MTEVEKSIRAFIREIADELATAIEDKAGCIPNGLRLSDDEINALINKMLDEEKVMNHGNG